MKSRAVFFNKTRNSEIREIDIPDPKVDEVQARTLFNGICMYEIWQYNDSDITEPFIPGHEGIGVVTRVGAEVKGIREGDYIVTSGWSDYTNQPAGSIVRISGKPETPDSFILEPVACVINATAYLKIYPGDRVILFGAGYMGLLLTQLLALYPLSRLIVVDIKDYNLKTALKLGADEVINSRDVNGQKRLEELLKDPFDITYECSASAEPLDWCFKLARTGGQVGIFSWHHTQRLINTSVWHEKGLSIINTAPATAVNERKYRPFEAAERLSTAGKIRQDLLVTHRYPLEEIEKAMRESTLRSGDFIKSVLIF